MFLEYTFDHSIGILEAFSHPLAYQRTLRQCGSEMASACAPPTPGDLKALYGRVADPKGLTGVSYTTFKFLDFSQKMIF